MKARYNPKQLHPAVLAEIDKEWDRREQKVFDACKRDIITQLLAVTLCYLNKRYGWKTKVLNSVKDGIQDMLVMMQKDGIMGQEFNTEHCIDYLEHMGITFKKG